MYCDPLRVERIQETLCWFDHPVIIGKHPVASFDLRPLATIIAKKKLHWAPGQSSEAEQEYAKGRILAHLSVCTVPLA